MPGVIVPLPFLYCAVALRPLVLLKMFLLVPSKAVLWRVERVEVVQAVGIAEGDRNLVRQG